MANTPKEQPGRNLPHHFEKAKNTTKSIAGRHAALSGWAEGTLKGYSSGMSKFIEFKEKTAGGFDEDTPIEDKDIYEFITWVGKLKVKVENGPDRVISSVTIKKYLDGIQAWHIVKHRSRPTADREVVSLMLSATQRNEEEKALLTNKKPIMIGQFYEFFKYAQGKSPELELAASISVIAFWGMARLGELLRGKAVNGALLRRHVEFGEREGTRFAKLHLRKAKTARGGEVQVIHLQQQFNVLDPVAALERVLEANPRADRDDLLFTWTSGRSQKTLTKARFTKLLEEVWGKASLGTWSGHSFRVGGASIRYNLGTPMKRIANQGRWKSLTYLRYLKSYTEAEIKETKRFLTALDERKTADRRS